LALRIFFRRLEIVGREWVPQGKVMFALNHPNGLIDPLFILCYAGRPVSFLAKAPLFTMPVIGYFVRAFRCLPVYRQKDNNDPAQNREMMKRAVELLAEGNALALFPEGTSHSDPRLKPFRSGAARIALSAAALADDTVKVVPVGLSYSRKHVFRSNALLLFGEPVEVRGGDAPAGGEPPRERVQALTEELAARVGALTLQAESVDQVYLAEIAQRIIVAANRDEGLPVPENMADKLDFQRQLVAGHARVEDHMALDALVLKLRAYEASVRALGLRVDDTFDYSAGVVVRYLVRTLLLFAVLAVPGLLGVVTHYATYRLVGWLAFRLAKSDVDAVATGKVAAGLLLFPLTWCFAALAAGIWWHPLLGVVVGLALPFAGYCALLWLESLAGLWVRGKALWFAVTKRGFVQHLVTERRAIRDEVLGLADLLERRSLEHQASLPDRTL
ncbi:MAG TPA: 1-acyl-sn-glycerol-3-phosphate acyltransferase, partial [Polyangiaceae bacterium]|nr:1-acyl-sn-glycerol-3-phosphate acyltransferase [Polyangiaceae bacterium]